MARPVFDVGVSPQEAEAFAGGLSWSAGRGFVLASVEMTAARLMGALGAPAAAAILRVDAGGAETAERRLATGSAAFLDLGEPFELRLTVPSRLTILAVSRAAMAERFASDSVWHGSALEAETAGARVFGSALQAFVREAGRPGEAEALAAGLVDLAARAARAGPAAAMATDTLVQVRRFIDQNFRSTKLDTAMIARAFGVSHASLYRLFAPLGGVAGYIRKARLAWARRIVVSPQQADRRIGDIALEAGFRSATVFNRLFLAEFGMTPSQARAASLGDCAQALFASGAEGELAARLRALA